MEEIRDKLIDIILKVAMCHHDDISKSDEDAACDAADEILKEIGEEPLLYFLSTQRDKDKDSDTRCVGYYTTLEGARKNVIGNAESLCEAGYYQYAIIEAFGPGWYPNAEIEEWYEFSDDGKEAKKIKKPKKYEQVCNFGIG